MSINSSGITIVKSLQEVLLGEGKVFSYEDYFTFDADETKTFVINPAAFAGTRITSLPVVAYSTAGPVLVNYYANTTSDEDGTLLEGSNRRMGFSPPTLTIRLNPTISDLGTRFTGDIIPATGTAPATSNSSSNIGILPFEISKTYKTSFTIQNKNGADTYLQLKLGWFEE